MLKTAHRGMCKVEELSDYNSNKERLGKPRKGVKHFAEALFEIEHNPDVQPGEPQAGEEAYNGEAHTIFVILR